MCLNNPAILITAEINESLLHELTSQGFKADIIPFIKIEIVRSKQLQEQIENILKENAVIVFTSSNAVEAVGDYIQNKKLSWEIYCIGNTTKNSVIKYFGDNAVEATANNAAALAEKLISDKEKHVYFFCGDKRRDELPDLLSRHNIIVNEIEVYTTIIHQHKIEKDYDAVLFFSPSAVQGFFKNNVIKEKTVLFAIGNTTADEIKKFSGNKIVVTNKPGKKELVENVIKFL
jgi:uroporphyrinogen-III synthase